jgi:hypothetical protein
MADSMEKRATRFEETVRLITRTLRWEARERVLALLGFLAFAVAATLPLGLSRLLESRLPEGLKPWISLPFWLTGLLCLTLVTLRIYRQVMAPLPQGELKLPALKGAASFTPEDAELFSQLGRGSDLEQLRAWVLDDQKPLIVLMGESGVGKTSLLRAGIANALRGDGIKTIYWEALPTAPEAGLMHAVQSQWGDNDAPGDNLSNLPAAIAGSRRVLMIDQLEQLSPNSAIFDLLQQALTIHPPYQGTWIIAFRREYSAAWVDFTLGLPVSARKRIETLSLKRFSLEAARRIGSILASTARLPVDQKVVDALVDGVAIDDHVSPVDLSVTLLGLGELAGTDGTPHLSIEKFRLSGGPTGLLIRYLERQLSLIPPNERNELLAALPALIDLDLNQRRAEGLNLTELAKRANPTSLARFEAALNFLASSKARILEIHSSEAGESRYRLLHERFIDPVRLLSGDLLAIVNQVALKLEEAYRAWSRTRSSRFLLSGRDLRLVLSHQGEIPWGEDERGKREFIQRSKRRRTIRRLLLTVACIALVVVTTKVRDLRYRQDLAILFSAWGLPSDLGDHLSQLDAIEIGPPISNIDWVDRTPNLKIIAVNIRPRTNNLPEILRIPSHVEEFSCTRCLVFPVSPTLKKLKLVNAPQQTRPLPKSIQVLDLSESPENHVGDRYLPPSLEELTYSADSILLYNQPPNQRPIKSVHLKVRSMLPGEKQRPDLSWIPRNVTWLEIDSTPRSLAGAPPHLQHLTMELTRKISKPEMKQLSSLRTLNIKVDLSLPEFGTPLPEILKPIESTDEAAGVYPLRNRSILRSLEISKCTGLDPSWLPRKLETLALGECPVRSLNGAPPELRALVLRSFWGFGAAKHSLKLPDGLESLSLWASSIEAIDRLPPKLRSLTYYGKWEDLSTRFEIPSTLESLELPMEKTPQSLFHFPPPRLKELTLPSSVKSLQGLPRTVRVLRLK